MKKRLLHLISASVLGVFLIFAYGSSDGKNSSPDSAPLDTKTTSNAKQIGEILKTEYFEVVVNESSLQDKIDTGNEFADLKEEEGNQYLVLNVTFKNTDNESRMIFDGEVLINYNGKDYLFDKSETVMLEGWGIMLDQINPLTSKTTNLVYKIPREIKGTAYYRPGRSESDDLIEIGMIQ